MEMIMAKKTVRRAKTNNSKEKWGLEGHYIHVRTVLLVPAKSENVAIEFVESVLNKYFSPVKTSYSVVDDDTDADTDTMPDERKSATRSSRGASNVDQANFASSAMIS
jgi:hypothetical protein